MSKKEEKTDKINKDEVTIGSTKFVINRKLKWSVLSKLTADYAEIERYQMSKKKDPMKTMEFAAKIDTWALNVLKDCLVDFDEKALDDDNATVKEINSIAASVFWAARNGISFLDLVSLTSSSMVPQKDSQQST